MAAFYGIEHRLATGRVAQERALQTEEWPDMSAV
jgi:hypothetical protein